MNKCKQCDFVCHDYAYLAQHIEQEHPSPQPLPKEQLREQLKEVLELNADIYDIDTVIDAVLPLLTQYSLSERSSVEVEIDSLVSEAWGYVDKARKDLETIENNLAELNQKKEDS